MHTYSPFVTFTFCIYIYIFFFGGGGGAIFSVAVSIQLNCYMSPSHLHHPYSLRSKPIYCLPEFPL